MKLLLLTPEILVLILQNVTTQDIVHVQQVCRQLRDVVETSLQLQYILTLKKTGYHLPLRPRVDLDYSLMIQMLHDNRDRWWEVKLKDPLFIDTPLPDTEIDESHACNKIDIFVDGVFAYIYRNCFQRSPEAVAYFHQLGSANKKVEYKCWSHKLKYRVVDMMIQPEADLLVLLAYNNVPMGEGNFHIHIRTMSTNEPHPLAAIPVITLNFSTPSPDHLMYQAHVLRIHGRMISIHSSGSYALAESQSVTIVWNWVTGVKAVSLEFTPEASSDGMAFVSEEYLAHPRHFQSDRPYNLDQLGYLEIHRIPHERERAAPFARLMLPGSYAHTLAVVTINDREQGSTPRGIQVRPEAKVFELASEDRQICVNISTQVDDRYPHVEENTRRGVHGWLCVSTRVLLKFLDRIRLNGQPTSHNGPVVISWGEWGSYASWVPIYENSFTQVFTRGHRCACLHYMRSAETAGFSHCVTMIQIVDLDQNRNRNGASVGIHPQIERTKYSPTLTFEELERRPTDKYLVLSEDDEVFRLALRPNAYYMRMYAIDGVDEFLNPRDDQDEYPSRFERIMMDDEHIVMRFGQDDPSIRSGLLVYTI